MNTTVYLIRHGEVQYKFNKQGRRLVYGKDAGLSEEGKKQISALIREFKRKGVKLDALYSSPLRRAVQTAEIFSDQYTLPHTVVQDFRDVESPAADQGMTMDELKALSGDTYSLPGHESQAHLTERITSTFEGILHENQGKTIAFVGHGDPIRVLIYRLKNPKEKLPPMKELSNWDYLDKAQAWRLVFDPELRLAEAEVIGGEKENKGLKRKF